jgi:hypothetical protein
MIRNIVDYQGTVLGQLELPDGTSEAVWQKKLAPYLVAPIIKTQQELDYDRYFKRAQAKDKILAEMASENMARVRAGIWTVPQLIELTQDTQLKQVLDDVSTLSFELAAQKLMSITSPLMTVDIKMSWIEKLQRHFYL